MNSDLFAIQKALENNWEEAILANQQILDQNPTDLNALNRLTHALIHIKKFKKAESSCQKVLTLDKENPIALKNLTKIKALLKNCHNICLDNCHQTISLIEEPGKSKVIPLVSLGESHILSILQPCLKLDFKIRKQSISFYYQNNYVGKLPNDIAKRLIWLSKRNNRYHAFIKSINRNKVSIYIKETKQSNRNQNYQSFID